MWYPSSRAAVIILVSMFVILLWEDLRTASGKHSILPATLCAIGGFIILLVLSFFIWPMGTL